MARDKKISISRFFPSSSLPCDIESTGTNGVALGVTLS